MDRISRMLQNAGPQGGNMAGPTSDAPQVDTAEQISISSLALLKMLKHGASWSPSTLFPVYGASTVLGIIINKSRPLILSVHLL